jgi:hypothetical protein
MPMVTTSPFKTARLSYRALDKDDKDFFLALWSDPSTQFGAMGSAVAPYGKDRAEKDTEGLRTAKMSCVFLFFSFFSTDFDHF